MSIKALSRLRETALSEETISGEDKAKFEKFKAALKELFDKEAKFAFRASTVEATIVYSYEIEGQELADFLKTMNGHEVYFEVSNRNTWVITLDFEI